MAGQSETAYGEDHGPHILEIYKVLLEMADRVSARRQVVNSFFLTLNTSLTALIGYAGLVSDDLDNPEFLVLIAAVGAVAAVLWLLMINSYNKLNDAKFRVILEVEQSLPVRPFYGERHVYKQLRLRGFREIEACIPVLFITIHTFAFLIAMIVFVKDVT